MINLTKAPFFLVKEDIEWVENTKKAMTLEEKIGQLFALIKGLFARIECPGVQSSSGGSVRSRCA